MNQIKSYFQDASFKSCNKLDFLFEDPHEPDSHQFDETDDDSKYFNMNEINTYLNDITQDENISVLNVRSCLR